MSVHDFWCGPLWLAVNLLMARAMWSAAQRLAPSDIWHERVRHALVLGCGCVLGVSILLGAIQQLTAASLLCGVTLVSAIAWYCASRPPREAGAELRSAPERGTPAEWWCWLGWSLWAGICGGRLIVSGLLEYPSNWDTLTYHLPFVDQWLAEGRLYASTAVKWFFPGNSELVALWMVAPFSGDFFAPLNNAPFIALLILSALQLGRLFGIAPLTNHVGVLALVSNYVVWHQLMDNKNDMAVVSLLVAALAYAFRHIRESRRADLLLAALCVGMLAGTKYYAVGYLAIVFATWIAATAYCRGIAPAGRVLAYGLLGILLWGGYWYARNLWISGMPFYPKALLAVGDVSTGVNPDFWRTSVLGNSHPEKWPLWWSAFWRMTGPCHLLALLLAPVSCGWLLVRGWQQRRAADRPGACLHGALGVVTLLSLALYLVTPFTIETTPDTLGMVKGGYVTVRLGLAAFSLTFLSGLILMDRAIPLPEWWVRGRQTTAVSGWLGSNRMVTHGLLCLGLGAVMFQFLFEHRDERVALDEILPENVLWNLLVADLLIAAGFLVHIGVRRFGQRPLARETLVALALVAVAFGTGLLGARWHANFNREFNRQFGTRVFHFLDQDPYRAATICVLGPKSFPFAGSYRQRQVVQVDNIPAQPLAFQTGFDALAVMRQHRAGLLATRHVGHWLTLELKTWHENHPGVFVPLEDDGQWMIFRIDQPLLEQYLDTMETSTRGEEPSTPRATST